MVVTHERTDSTLQDSIDSVDSSKESTCRWGLGLGFRGIDASRCKESTGRSFEVDSSIKLQVSLAKEPYKRGYILQKVDSSKESTCRFLASTGIYRFHSTGLYREQIPLYRTL